MQHSDTYTFQQHLMSMCEWINTYIIPDFHFKWSIHFKFIFNIILSGNVLLETGVDFELFWNGIMRGYGFGYGIYFWWLTWGIGNLQGNEIICTQLNHTTVSQSLLLKQIKSNTNSNTKQYIHYYIISNQIILNTYSDNNWIMTLLYRGNYNRG